MKSSPIWLFLPLLALIGALKVPEERWVWPPVIWGGLHFLLLTVIGQSVYAWDMAPLIPALVILCSLGIVWIREHLKIPGQNGQSVSSLGCWRSARQPRP